MSGSPSAGGDAGKPPAVGKILSKEERADLLNYHVNRLVHQKAVIEEARVPYDEAKDGLKDLIATAKSDLGKRYTRKRLMGLVDDRSAKLRDLTREEEERAEDRIALSLPLFGRQHDAFNIGGDETPEEVRDENFWRAEGYLAGLRGQAAHPLPDGIPPRMGPIWLEGRAKGQDELVERIGRGQKLSEAIAQPDPEAETPDLNAGADDDGGDGGEPPPEVPDLQEVEADAKKLKAKGWDKRQAAPAGVH